MYPCSNEQQIGVLYVRFRDFNHGFDTDIVLHFACSGADRFRCFTGVPVPALIQDKDIHLYLQFRAALAAEIADTD
jgi:hypothetical protein